MPIPVVLLRVLAGLLAALSLLFAALTTWTAITEPALRSRSVMATVILLIGTGVFVWRFRRIGR